MRVAFFGGTFDPIHRGHLAVAAAAADAFALDRVLFAPAGRQPLKMEDTPTAFADRVAMVALACMVDSRFGVSEVDAPHADGSANYTVDTLAVLRRELPLDTLFVLVGADSFLGLPKWREPERLLELAEWSVVSRPGFSLDAVHGMEQAERQRHEGRVHLLESVHEDVSATELRLRLGHGEDCSELVTDAVLRYVQEHNLYRSR